ncbi:MAG: hypothetical protein A2W26_11640 [Acidobacteria bacterium RBG_16_64_8]|nr:MAG: hypothetical protein A2W26_11640 [Acidobacteria bacterium RBG_16_64_8]
MAIRKLLVLVLLLAFIVSLQSVHAPAAPTGALTVAQPTDITFLIPMRGTFSSDASVHYAIMDPLLMRDEHGKFIPMLATRWRNISPTEWEFDLRRGVKFHNGEDFTAQTVAWNMQYTLNPAPGVIRAPVFNTFAGADVVNPYQVRIRTKRPDPLLLANMVRWFMLPPAYMEREGDDGWMRQPVGTGPYRWVSYTRGANVKLVANTAYWASAPTIREITFRIIPDASTRFAALRAREVHVLAGLTPDQAELLEADRNGPAVLMSAPSVRGALIQFFPDSPQGGGEPLKDRRVRQALNLGVDVERIIKFVLRGQAVRTPTLFPPAGFTYNKNLPPYPYDPERAKALRAEAGYPSGFNATMEVPPTFVVPKTMEVAQVVAEDLRKIGVNVTIRPVELGTMVSARAQRRLAPLYFWSWGSDTLDPDSFYFRYAYTKYMFGWVGTQEIDQLIERGATTMNPVTREGIYKQLHPMVKDLAPAIFLYMSKDLYGVSKRVDWTPRVDEYILVKNIRWAR